MLASKYIHESTAHGKVKSNHIEIVVSIKIGNGILKIETWKIIRPENLIFL